MTEPLSIALLVSYATLLTILFLYGLNFLYLVVQAWRLRGPDPTPPQIERPTQVTVQVPIYNERFVAERAVDAAARLRWPPDLLEVQILDDSTDDTIDIVRKRVDFWRGKGVPIKHLHRADRTGYKAGALAHGTAEATGTFMAVFDADFVPPAGLS